jgi:hypothetical protein
MQQLPPFPDNDPSPDSPQPAQPSHAPAEEPGHDPNIDVPSPGAPDRQPPTTPISPVS